MHDATIVTRIVGSILCVLGIIVCWRLRKAEFHETSTAKHLVFGLLLVSTLSYLKALAFFGFIVVPVSTVGVANFHLAESTHKVEGCASCHVMLPMVNDMQDPNSDTLAARHFRNRWIPHSQCYQCHADYGFAGDFEAKMTGFRHLARYTTRSFQEPIQGRTPFKNRNCLKCHQSSPRFAEVKSHMAVYDYLVASTMSCTNCHGLPHPTRAARTPGSPDYTRLMEPLK